MKIKSLMNDFNLTKDKVYKVIKEEQTRRGRIFKVVGNSGIECYVYEDYVEIVK